MKRASIVLAIMLTSTVSHATCQADAYTDFNDCNKAISKAQQDSNGTATDAGGVLGDQGDAQGADTVRTVAMQTAANWKVAHDTCQKKLEDCQKKCTSPDDAQYLKACNKSIQENVDLAAGQMSANRSYASATGASTTLTKSADSKFDDSVIDSEKAQTPDDVQQTGLVSSAVAACKIGAVLASCYMNPGQQPSITDTVYGQPRIMRIAPSGLGR